MPSTLTMTSPSCRPASCAAAPGWMCEELGHMLMTVKRRPAKIMLATIPARMVASRLGIVAR